MLLNNKGKATFNQIAADYDAVRPLYPTGLYDYLVRVGNWNANSRLLEIGCGTGQLTRELGKLDLQLHAIDIGDQLIARARANCQNQLNVTFSKSSFEDLEVPPASYDAILAATSFHWLDPNSRFKKSAALLAPAGQLFIISNVSKHREQTAIIRQKLDRIYKQVIPPEISRQYVSLENRGGSLEEEFASSPLFGPVAVFRQPYIHTLSSEQYIQLLNTFSYQHNLPKVVRETLFQEIKLVVDEHGGQIELPYEARVIWARKA